MIAFERVLMDNYSIGNDVSMSVFIRKDKSIQTFYWVDLPVIKTFFAPV